MNTDLRVLIELHTHAAKNKLKLLHEEEERNGNEYKHKPKKHTGNLQQIRSVEEEDTENLESTVDGSMIKTPLKIAKRSQLNLENSSLKNTTKKSGH